MGERKEGGGAELKGVATRRAGRERCEDRQGGTLHSLVVRLKESSVRLVYFAYFSFPFFSFFLFPLFVAELICSVHVTEILPLHVCLSPILPPSGRLAGLNNRCKK